MSEENAIPIDLNQADAEALATLPGLGPKLAGRIIQYRQENGPFSYPGDIANVPGISGDLFLRFADQVTVTMPDVSEKTIAEPPEVVTESEVIEPAKEANSIAESDIIAEPPAAEKVPAVSDTPAKDEAEEGGYLLMWGEEEEEKAHATEVEESAIVPILGTESTKTESVAARQEPPAKPVKQGIWRPWVLMVVALFGGAVLALLVIQALNGTLMLGSRAEIETLRSRLNTLEKENQTLNKQIEEMQTTLNQYADLSADMQNNRAEILLLKQARDKLEGQTETLSQRADNLDASVISLAEEAVKMQKAITLLENDAGRFNTFLTGLRTLMISVVDETDAALEPTPAAPAKNATATPTATPQK